MKALRANRASEGRHSCRPRLAATGMSLLVAVVLLSAWLSQAAVPVVVTSHSKQFTVRGARLLTIADTASQPSGLALLDPALVAVTAESIRYTLQQELAWSNTWRGHVFIDLRPARHDNEKILLTSLRSSDGWNYRVEMPDEVDSTRLVRVMVEVLLAEFAQREAGERQVEFPPWLVPGFTTHLQAGPLAGIVLAPNRSVLRTRGKTNPLAAVRAHLQSVSALTVDQLNWPAEDQFDGANAEHYEACAHLFVHELLRLRGGADCLREMLTLLPQHLNWQTAFFRAFRPHFQRMLDVEKWWSLVLVNLAGRDTSEIWPMPESRQRLDEVLYTPVQVRLEKDEMPHDSQVALQTVLTEWDPARQVLLLQQKIARLAELQPHLAPEVVKLASNYRRVMEEFLRALGHDQAVAHPQEASKRRIIMQDAISGLNALDRQREKLWKLNAAPNKLRPKSGKER